MTKPLHLIYITGLGDQNPNGQRRAVANWKRWGVEAELFQVYWSKGEWAPKLQALLARIDTLTKEGKDVGLVGASAGASAAINAYAARKDKIVGCVLIAGKVNRPQTVGQHYRKENPAFVTSIYDCEKALKTLDALYRQRILSRYALIDETVYKLDSRIQGAHNRLVPTVGHVPTIALQITLGVPSFVRFLKKQQKAYNN